MLSPESSGRAFSPATEGVLSHPWRAKPARCSLRIPALGSKASFSPHWDLWLAASSAFQPRECHSSVTHCSSNSLGAAQKGLGNVSGTGSVILTAAVAMLDCLGLCINPAGGVTPIKHFSKATNVFLWVVLNTCCQSLLDPQLLNELSGMKSV